MKTTLVLTPEVTTVYKVALPSTISNMIAMTITSRVGVEVGVGVGRRGM